MEWIQVITLFLAIIVTVFTAAMWIISRIEHSEEKLNARMDVLGSKLDLIDQRLSRLEGRFEERGYWESRKTGTEQK